MAKISWTDEAVAWMQDIHDYIAQENPGAAKKATKAIFDKVQILDTFPQMGHRYEKIPGREIRIILFKHYRIAYLVKPSGDIDILGIFHGALEIDRYLF